MKNSEKANKKEKLKKLLPRLGIKSRCNSFQQAIYICVCVCVCVYVCVCVCVLTTIYGSNGCAIIERMNEVLYSVQLRTSQLEQFI